MLSLREAKSSSFPLKQQQSLLGEEEEGGFLSGPDQEQGAQCFP